MSGRDIDAGDPIPRGPRPSPAVDGLPVYERAGRPTPIDLHLDGNEGAPPDRDLLEQLLAGGTEVLRRYPDAADLEAELARRVGVEPANLVVTAGADDALRRACAAVLAPGREIVLPRPTFAMLPLSARRTGGTVVAVRWDDGPYPVDAVLDAAGADTAAIAVVSPNNPTGAVATADDIERLCTARPEALVMVDLAYGEFAREDLTPAALRFPNALVIRTLSKARGLAGLRVGYAIGSPRIIRWMRAAGDPYAVAGPSLHLALAALNQGDEVMRDYISTVRAERQRIGAVLKEMGARTTRSQGNFVLGHFRNAGWVRDALAGLGIAVRAFRSDPSLHSALRITCPGSVADTDRVVAAVRAVMRPEALLVDVDTWLGIAASGSPARPVNAESSPLAGRSLQRLARNTRLAVLTDRADAARSALQVLGVADRVGTMVERPAGSTEPEPVRRAMGALGVERAWLLGDRAAPLEAARSAGLVPVGLRPPGPDDAGPADDLSLLTAGAGRVFRSLSELEEVWP